MRGETAVSPLITPLRQTNTPLAAKRKFGGDTTAPPSALYHHQASRSGGNGRSVPCKRMLRYSSSLF